MIFKYSMEARVRRYVYALFLTIHATAKCGYKYGICMKITVH